jgi:hypothetical protein
MVLAWPVYVQQTGRAKTQGNCWCGLIGVAGFAIAARLFFGKFRNYPNVELGTLNFLNFEL